jgi:hyaluronan synthase
MLAVDYPAAKLELVAVNDGSSDRTGFVLDEVAARNPRVQVIHFPENRGKRAAMAAGIRATSAEVVCFVDSDSILAPDALRALVQPLADERVAAVAGHADVLNSGETWLTRMQTIRYLIAFRVYKGAESLFGAVTCCSGCFAAYRRAAIEPHLAAWEGQSFLGIPSTYGDDRSLTNFVLRDWRVVYQSRARSATIVPADLSQFLRQQARWKRSWTRESLVLGRFLWRKHPAAAAATYVAMVLPLLAPIACVRALFWRPLAGNGALPLVYLGGALAMGILYALYYAARRGFGGNPWLFGLVLVACHLTVLMWQTYYAIATVRHTSWGTRAAPVAPRSARLWWRRVALEQAATGDA